MTAGLSTPLCRALGIAHPIFSAPLGGGTAGPELAAAVSNAGGLGLLGMGGVPAFIIRQQIRETRTLTSRPFGVGLLLPLLEGGELEVCIEERIPVLLLFWGEVRSHIEKANAAGIKVFVQVGTVAEAQRAADAGAYGVVAQGFEAGGHVRGTTSLAIIVPAVVEAVAPLPVVAAGGIATGRGLAAALGLGAQAISMGTRFVASAESRAAAQYKQRIVRAKAEDTVYTSLFDIGWPDAPHRVLRNKAIDEWEAAGSPPPGKRPGEGAVIGTLPAGDGTIGLPRYSVACPTVGFDGDLEYAALYAGESCTLVNDIKPAGTIVREVIAEAEAVLAGLRS